MKFYATVYFSVSSKLSSDLCWNECEHRRMESRLSNRAAWTQCHRMDRHWHQAFRYVHCFCHRPKSSIVVKSSADNRVITIILSLNIRIWFSYCRQDIKAPSPVCSHSSSVIRSSLICESKEKPAHREEEPVGWLPAHGETKAIENPVLQSKYCITLSS